VGRLALLVCTTLALFTGIAGAGTLTRNGSTLLFTGSPGERNDVEVGIVSTPDFYDISDRATTMGSDPSWGCDSGSCNVPGISSLQVDLGDGDDKFQGALRTVPTTVNGGDGNDDLGGNGATVHGGPGDDIVHGYPTGPGGSNYLDGGPGDDVIDPYSGPDTIDCTGGGNDRITEILSGQKLVGCGPPPKLAVGLSRVRFRGLLGGKLKVTIACDRPCVLSWALVGGDRKTQGMIHSGCGCLALRNYARDREHTWLEYTPAGRQSFRVSHLFLGPSTRKGLSHGRSFKFDLSVVAQSNLGVLTRAHKRFVVKR